MKMIIKAFFISILLGVSHSVCADILAKGDILKYPSGTRSITFSIVPVANHPQTAKLAIKPNPVIGSNTQQPADMVVYVDQSGSAKITKSVSSNMGGKVICIGPGRVNVTFQ